MNNGTCQAQHFIYLNDKNFNNPIQK